MSILPSTMMFLCLITCMHSCLARHLAVTGHGFSELRSSSKVTEKIKVSISPNQHGATNGSGIAEGVHGCAKGSKGFDEEKKSAEGATSGVISSESLVSVSWRLPHKNGDESGHPGIYSDYSRPRTRSPSHN